MKENIVLIGMPGCGKSTMGIVLAKMMCMDFLDTDLLIQKETGMSLQEYIDTRGVECFLDAEAEIISALRCSNAVIATGGSAIIRDKAAERLHTLGKNVYLSVPPSDIERRVTNLSSRGVAMESGESLSDVFAKRTPIYEKNADIVFDVSGDDIATNCIKLQKILKEKYENG